MRGLEKPISGGIGRGKEGKIKPFSMIARPLLYNSYLVRQSQFILQSLLQSEVEDP
jgi:hypothetical protein